MFPVEYMKKNQQTNKKQTWMPAQAVIQGKFTAFLNSQRTASSSDLYFEVAGMEILRHTKSLGIYGPM